MREITIKLYKYDELPTEEAKAKARKWQADIEESNAVWYDEHFKSMDAVIKEVQAIRDAHTDEYGEVESSDALDLSMAQLYDTCEKAELTGYCADALYCDFMDKFPDILLNEDRLKRFFVSEWDKELSDRLVDREYLEESIRCNEYEFMANGERSDL